MGVWVDASSSEKIHGRKVYRSGVGAMKIWEWMGYRAQMTMELKRAMRAEMSDVARRPNNGTQCIVRLPQDKLKKISTRSAQDGALSTNNAWRRSKILGKK